MKVGNGGAFDLTMFLCSIRRLRLAIFVVAVLGLEDGLPPAVVVHGRRGPNSNINGMYIRDSSWQGQIGPCYKRAGSGERHAIFLYFEGEWRLGPSPEHGSVWAFARSSAASPLQVDMPWQVWDGQRVVQDEQLQVSDTSVVPSVLFLSLGDGTPLDIRWAQGMLLQQPGLWDGRPYYRHRAYQDLYLLCSVAEGHWRLGPLPLAGSNDGSTLQSTNSASTGALLVSRSAAALPQEIVEVWMNPSNVPGGFEPLPDGSVRLAPTGLGQLGSAVFHQEQLHQQQPRHLVIEGMLSGNGVANGIYRLAAETVNMRPVYQKTDALRAASLWFAGADWRIGPSLHGSRVWAYSPVAAESPLTTAPGSWISADDGQAEEVMQIMDATEVIPATLMISGVRFVQELRLCDARPVYKQEKPSESSLKELGTEAANQEVFLFFRAHEVEWWLGPEVGGTECFARASGSLLTVVPEAAELQWRQPQAPKVILSQAPTEPKIAGHEIGSSRVSVLASTSHPQGWWIGVALSGFVVVVIGASCFILLAPVEAPSEEDGIYSAAYRIAEALEWYFSGVFFSPKHSGSKKISTAMPLELACVVCLEAPRQILLMPCRHVCCCKVCAEKLERCPMCRAETTTSSEVFL